MGFLDKFKKKVEQKVADTRHEKDSSPPSSQPQGGKRIKKYTSDGKPVYE